MNKNFNWYESYYKKISIAGQDGSLGNKLHHLPLEKGYSKNSFFRNVLELGGGEGEHIPHIKHDFENWTILDIRELILDIKDPRITYVQADAHNLPYEDSVFDRVVITCLLHHAESPWQILDEARRVLKDAGTLEILLPTDPSIFYKTAQFLTTGIRALKSGVYKLSRTVHSFEHRNHYSSLSNMINFIFERDEIKITFTPFFIRVSFLNLFAVYRIKIRKV